MPITNSKDPDTKGMYNAVLDDIKVGELELWLVEQYVRPVSLKNSIVVKSNKGGKEMERYTSNIISQLRGYAKRLALDSKAVHLFRPKGNGFAIETIGDNEVVYEVWELRVRTNYNPERYQQKEVRK